MVTKPKKNPATPSPKAKRSGKPKPDTTVVPASEPAPTEKTPTAAAPQDNATSPTTTAAEPLTVTEVTTGRTSAVRATIVGRPVTAVLRWMGKHEWDFDKARRTLDNLGAESYSSTTIRIQTRAGKVGQRGPVPELTEAEVAELEAAASKN